MRRTARHVLVQDKSRRLAAECQWDLGRMTATDRFPFPFCDSWDWTSRDSDRQCARITRQLGETRRRRGENFACFRALALSDVASALHFHIVLDSELGRLDIRY